MNRVGLYLRLGPLDYQQQEYSFAIQDIERLEVITVADDVSLHVNTDSDEIKITCVDSCLLYTSDHRRTDTSKEDSQNGNS